jgi:uncharacterized cupin superfamily protein
LTTIVRQKEMFENVKCLQHPLDKSAERNAVSLGDLTGLSKCGIHFTVLKPGKTSTVPHRHHLADEFVFVISGRGEVILDEQNFEVATGDFIGLPKGGPSHAMKNNSSEDLIYLVGGDRPDFDVCDYPKLKKRVYLHQSGGKRNLDFIDHAAINAK